MDERPTHLDLFSGIGGFALAAQWAGFRTIGFCEIDKYCQKVLAKNFLSDSTNSRCEIRSPFGSSSDNREVGTGESARNDAIRRESGRRCEIYGNIFDLDGRQFYGVDLITGGFPCQPFSVAGKRRGAADDRAIWPQMFRVISEARPAWILGENVPGIVPMELDNVLSDLEGIDYATRSFVIPACAVDARHRRDRLWIIGRLCNTTEQRFQNGTSVSMGNSRGIQPEFERSDSDRECRWLAEPNVGRVAHGIPSRVDRLKGLGNAIVPQVAYEILKEIRKLI